MLPPAERAGQAESSGFSGNLREGGAKLDKPAARPRREKKGIGEGKIACLRLPAATRRQTGATCPPPPVCVRTRTGRRRGRQAHRQVKERFVGPLARLLSGQGVGRIRRPAGPGRCAGEAQVIEDLPDLPAGRQATGGRLSAVSAQAGSIMAMTFIVPPHWAQRRGSTS